MRKTLLKIIYILTLNIVFLFFGKISLAANHLDLTIIEIGAYKKSGYEYLKIHNNTNQKIDLKNWKFVENFSSSKPNGEKHSLKEYNNSGFILEADSSAVICQDPEKFLSEENFSGLILDSSWGSLKENGEKIQLLDNNGNIIESFTYLPCPNGPLLRKDFQKEDYGNGNWVSENQNNENINDNNNDTENQNKNEKTETNEKPKIIINEIFPNPIGPDNENEFIELKNIGNSTISLNNWTIKNNSKRTYQIFEKNYKNSFIKPNQFFIIKRSKSRLPLDNSQDTIKLYNQKNKLIDKISYKINIPENYSFARDTNNEWRLTDTATPDKENILPPKNDPPILKLENFPQESEVNKKIFFDASDSYDPDGNDIFFIWFFGDGSSSTLINPTHAYHQAGEYNLKIIAFDSLDASSTLNFKIKIKNKTENISSKHYLPIFINEIFPNPIGSDDDEFIELFNPNQEMVNLKNWSIQDKSGKKFIIKNDLEIFPNDYYTFLKEETKLTLNNTFDTVKLLNPLGEKISEIAYKNAPENLSFSYFQKDKKWEWTKEITPDEKNKKNVFYNNKKNIQNHLDFLKIKITEISKAPLNETIETNGVVVAPPNLFGKQIFYLNGLEIYMFKADFPNLNIGDEINVKGVLNKFKEKYRLKIKSKNDIKILGKKEIFPLKASIDEIDDNFLNRLLEIEGEILDKKNNNFWIADDFGELLITIKPKTKISLNNFQDNDQIKIIGILQKQGNEFTLLPRYQNDLKKIQGKISATKKEILSKNSFFQKKYYKYFLITFLAIVVIALEQYRQRKK